MKRLFCLLLAVCMMASLCACGKGREKDAGNDTLSSDEESSASAEIIPTPNEQETPEGSEPSQPSAGKVDVDLTVLSSTMVYSEVYNKVIMCIRSSEMENFRSGGNEENTLKVEQLQLYTQRPAEWVSAVQRCIEALRSSQRA